MRGRRFHRPAAKKLSAREKTKEHATSTFYQKPEPVNPSQLSSKILNAIEHLGSQRFALPPFSEHFQRWMSDIRALLMEFESELPGAVDKQYRENVEKSLSIVQEVLTKRIEVEKNASSEISNLHQRLAATEIELSKFDHDYKTHIRQIRSRHERSAQELGEEIASIDKQRMKILREKPNFLQRIFRRSESTLEERTSELQSKRNSLGRSKQTLKEELEKSRADYESRRKHIVEEHEELRAKMAELSGKTLDDALEIRKIACQELHRTVSEAVGRLLREQSSQSTATVQ